MLVVAAAAIVLVAQRTTCHVDMCNDNVLADALILLAGLAAAFFVLDAWWVLAICASFIGGFEPEGRLDD